MSRYIEAESLIDHLYEEEFTIICPLDEVSGVINNEPTADVQPVQHGKWIEQGEPYIDTYECSCCGRWFTLDYGTLKENNYNYCPKCGAKLKGEENL